MSARGWTTWGRMAGFYFVMLWVTKPLTTGGRDWTPTPLAHLVTAIVVAVLWCSIRVAERSRS